MGVSAYLLDPFLSLLDEQSAGETTGERDETYILRERCLVRVVDLWNEHIPVSHTNLRSRIAETRLSDRCYQCIIGYRDKYEYTP